MTMTIPVFVVVTPVLLAVFGAAIGSAIFRPRRRGSLILAWLAAFGVVVLIGLSTNVLMNGLAFLVLPLIAGIAGPAIEWAIVDRPGSSDSVQAESPAEPGPADGIPPVR
jgi:hypothetical protein